MAASIRAPRRRHFPHRPPPPPQAPATSIPWLGLLAVLMGTFISTLNGRLSTFGLTDIRGAVHAGFDEGAWITTAQTVAQMLIALAAVWLGAIYGPRRVLLWASIAFAVISLAYAASPHRCPCCSVCSSPAASPRASSFR